MKKSILIVGGTGFIGTNLLNKIKKNDFQIFCISTKLPIQKKKIKKVTYIKCDISKRNEVKKKLKRFNFDTVLNLGGYIDHSNTHKTMRSHFVGCKNLINFFKNKRIDNFIQIGSSLEYGKKRSPHKENYEKLIPRGNYGLAKLKATKYVLKQGLKHNIPFTILRLYQIYGPGQTIDRLIPMAIKSFLKNGNFKCSAGYQLRDFLFVDDLVRLLIIIIRKKKIQNQIFNIGSGKAISVKKLIKLIYKLIAKGKPEFGVIKMRKDEILKSIPSISKVKKQFNWKPKVSIKEGLKKTISYYEKV